MDKPIESYKYQKVCRLSRCKKAFETNREWQDFCEASHRIEYNQVEAKALKSISNRLDKLEGKMKELEESIKKAVKEAGRMAVFLSPKKGGAKPTEKKKTKR